MTRVIEHHYAHLNYNSVIQELILSCVLLPYSTNCVVSVALTVNKA